VSDGIQTNSVSFPLTVLFVDQPPVINGLTNQTTPANLPLSVNFTVSDVDTPASNLVVSATVSDSSLGAVTVMGNERLTYTPRGAVGTNIVLVTVSDGAVTATNSFAVLLLAPVERPLLGITRVGDLLKIRVSSGPSNAICVLQGTSDLKAWGDIKSATTDASGSVEFDLELPAPSTQFYRVLVK